MSKKIIVIGLFILTFIISGCISSDASPSQTTSKTQPTTVAATAPDFTVHSLDGKKVKLSDLRGQTVFLNFWATWCPPCITEMPYIQENYQSYNDKVAFFIVSVDDKKADVQQFIQKNDYTFPVYFSDKNEIFQAYALQGIPTSYMIAPDGKIVGTHLGGMNKIMMQEFIKKALTEQ